ncbi:DUF2971 domain-containing protein [Tritonibacter mobilis]|uniref:DUF2971 domain-containing protein n=1 Tax=Tritonibacter mobilis TaxID=379347 RepID=UPI000806AA2B|nr:DUF2971 domain-containing protein [Tritonibacter mobilis]
MIEQSTLPTGVRDFLAVVVSGYADHTDGFAFCLSEDPDLLSQWRAYADDGRGLALGFDASLLEKDYEAESFGARFFQLTKVEYSKETTRAKIASLIRSLEEQLSDHGEFVKLREGFTRDRAIQALVPNGSNPERVFDYLMHNDPDVASRALSMLSGLHFEIYQYKPRAFEEEREWRLLRYRHRVPEREIKFLAKDTTIKPFIESDFSQSAIRALHEITVGPKHTSDIGWLRTFLDANELEHVTIHRSTAGSYR